MSRNAKARHRPRSRDELREALSDAWALAVGVAEELRDYHPERYQHCRLSVRVLTGALLAIDRAVAEIVE